MVLCFSDVAAFTIFCTEMRSPLAIAIDIADLSSTSDMMVIIYIIHHNYLTNTPY